MTDPYKPYVQKYLEASKTVPFTPNRGRSRKQEAVRYCLVNGLLPLTRDAVALVEREFYLDADRLPPELRTNLEKRMNGDLDWGPDEDRDSETEEVISADLRGVWIKNRCIVGLKKLEKSRQVVWTECDTEEMVGVEIE